MHSLSYNDRTHRVLMGGLQEKLVEFDISTQKETRVETLPEKATCPIIRDNSRFVCCGDVSGKVQLRDTRTLKVQHTFEGHGGVLNDFDVLGNNVVTCGQSTRHGIPQPDRFLMVYDLRVSVY